jgi:hypothetical protein
LKSRLPLGPYREIEPGNPGWPSTQHCHVSHPRSTAGFDRYAKTTRRAVFLAEMEDEIYNLACPASPIHYQFDPVQTTKTSVKRIKYAALTVLGFARFTPFRQVLLVESPSRCRVG